MLSLLTHHIPQTLLGLVLWLLWVASAAAYSNPHPAHEFATACKTADAQKLGWAYIYDETGTLLGEYGMGGAASSGSTEHIYLPTAAGPLPVATVINGQHYAVHTDHLNTPRRLTAANNQAVWQWAYSAFGQEQATTANKRFTSANTIPATGSTTTQPVAYHQRYPGQSFDVESGLHYNYFRTYDPQTGRYTQADPIGLSGGWNRYAYVNGNPLGAVDPKGLQAIRPRPAPFLPFGPNESSGEYYDRQTDRFTPQGGPSLTIPPMVPRPGMFSPMMNACLIGFEVVRQWMLSEGGGGNNFPDRDLPRDPIHNTPVPDPEAEGRPYTQLGQRDGRRGRYGQAREFDSNGNPVRDIDFTDHGRGHPNPHQHDYVPNPTGGTPSRGNHRPLK